MKFEAGAFSLPARGALLLYPETLEALVEARELAAVDQPLLTAGPGGMRLRIDVGRERVAGLAVGRSSLVGGAVGHHDGDLVIIRMDAVFHRHAPRKGGFIAERGRSRNSPCGAGAAARSSRERLASRRAPEAIARASRADLFSRSARRAVPRASDSRCDTWAASHAGGTAPDSPGNAQRKHRERRSRLGFHSLPGTKNAARPHSIAIPFDFRLRLS